MTPHPEPLKSEVGVRELHDRLSRYVQHVKDGAEVVVELWDRADLLVSSQLVYPEARAALAAAARARRIDEPTHSAAIATLEELYAQLRIIAIDEPLARQAGDLAAQHALHGDDAVHLACALQLQGRDILLATWDNALNAAARATGRLIANDAP